ELLGQVVGAIGEPDHLQHLVYPALEKVAAQAVQPAEEDQVLATGQVRVDRQVLGHEPDPVPPAGGADRDLLAGHDHLARVGGEEPGDHRDGGGLTGTVGTEKPVGLPRLDMETDTIHCHQVAETLPEAVDGQHLTHVITSLPGGSGYGRRPGYSRSYGPLRRVRRHASASRGPWRGGRAHRPDPWSRWLGARLRSEEH